MNQVAPKNEFRDQFTRMENEMKMALPVHIPVERFMRVVLTAVNGNPDLLQADRQSLFESCMKAAQDGLLPDGREGALVVYNTNIAKPGQEKRWIKKVQWMPMVAGIMKKARNSGEIALITAGYVVGGDKFRYWIDDDGEHIFYEPGEKQDFNTFVCAFAMAKTKDGVIYALRVSPADVEKMRNASKAKDGPAWKNWYDQMAMKGAIRRLAKRLPMSSDLDDLIRRDDELYDFKGNREDAIPFSPVKNPLRDEAPAQQTIEHDAGDGVGRDGETGYDSDEISDDDRARFDREHEQDTPRTAYRGNMDLYNTADLVIEPDGSFSKNRHGGGIGEADLILDLREPEGRQLTSRQDREKAAADKAKPAEKTEQAASASQATTKETAKSAEPEQKPYTDGPSYLVHAKKQIDATKTAAKCTDYWGSTRAERNAVLNDDEIDDLTVYKSAHLKKLKGS